MGVGLSPVQDQNRIPHVVFDEVEDGFGHHHVRGGHPVVDGHDGPVGAVVHEGIGIERGDPLVVQGTQQLANRHASSRAGVNRPIKVDEENLRLRTRGGTVGIQVGGLHTHVSSSCSCFCLVSNVPASPPPRHAGTIFELGAKSAHARRTGSAESKSRGQ